MDMCSTENESNPTTDGTDGTTEERMRTTDSYETADAKEYVDYEFDPWFLYYYNYKQVNGKENLEQVANVHIYHKYYINKICFGK